MFVEEQGNPLRSTEAELKYVVVYYVALRNLTF